RVGDGALARARQAGEPQRRALLLQQGGALFARDVALVPGDVRRPDLGHSSHPSGGHTAPRGAVPRVPKTPPGALFLKSKAPGGCLRTRGGPPRSPRWQPGEKRPRSLSPLDAPAPRPG